MNVDELKEKIVKKFGSVNKFCNCANINYQTLSNLFRQQDSPSRQSKLKELARKVTKTKIKKLDGFEITDKLIEKIRVAIVTNHKTYQAFCDAHSISNTWLSALLNGKHKLVSKRVRNLCLILEIKI